MHVLNFLSMPALDPTWPQSRNSSAEPFIGGVMESPAVASTYALWMVLTDPQATEARARLSQWASEATSLLGELLHDRLAAERMVADLLAGRPARVADTADLAAELRQILDANIELGRAEY